VLLAARSLGQADGTDDAGADLLTRDANTKETMRGGDSIRLRYIWGKLASLRSARSAFMERVFVRPGEATVLGHWKGPSSLHRGRQIPRGWPVHRR
jgi:hypothetical protein